jgi:tetraacyldisaccharide 4'-kinase
LKAPSPGPRLVGWLHQQWQHKGLWAWLTSPFSLLAFIVLSLRRVLLRSIAECTTRAPVPLIVVGNLYIGGTGKTPIVIAILEELRAKGWRPGVISRGYGVRAGSEARTGSGALDPSHFGDEPALIAQESGAPISVHPNRRLAWQALIQAYPQTDVIVSDDGLQHATLMRDIELLVQDVRGVGNGWLLPAGPLRDPPSRLRTVDALITRLTETQIAPPSLNLAPKELVARMRISGFQQMQSGQRLDPSRFLQFCKNKSLAAFAGIGAPERFFADLRALGLQVPLTTALPDHCAFNANTLDAPEADLVLITSKDAIKCNLLLDSKIWVAQTHSTFSDPSFADWLHERLRQIQTALR